MSDKRNDDYSNDIEKKIEDELDDDLKEDLDIELIRELNEIYGDEEEAENEEHEAQKPLGTKVVAFLVVVIFIGFLVGNWLRVFAWPSLDFLEEWSSLSSEPHIQELKESVVRIEARGKGGIPEVNSSGTGFNISSKGLIITNRHVLQDAGGARITFPGEGVFFASNWRSSEEVDLAVIKLNGSDLPMLELETGAMPEPGEEVTIIGNPHGLDRVVMQGEVTRYRYGDGQYQLMEISAPIQSGSSGSPVINSEMKVVGVIFASSHIEGSENIRGLAIPVSQIENLVKDI